MKKLNVLSAMAMDNWERMIALRVTASARCLDTSLIGLI